jgi:hypothetical protein
VEFGGDALLGRVHVFTCVGRWNGIISLPHGSRSGTHAHERGGGVSCTYRRSQLYASESECCQAFLRTGCTRNCRACRRSQFRCRAACMRCFRLRNGASRSMQDTRRCCRCVATVGKRHRHRCYPGSCPRHRHLQSTLCTRALAAAGRKSAGPSTCTSAPLVPVLEVLWRLQVRGVFFVELPVGVGQLVPATASQRMTSVRGDVDFGHQIDGPVGFLDVFPAQQIEEVVFSVKFLVRIVAMYISSKQQVRRHAVILKPPSNHRRTWS